MILGQVETILSLWKQGSTVNQLLNILTEYPDDKAILDSITESFQGIRQQLSKQLLERIAYLFSGADITPNDLRSAGAQCLDELSVIINKSLLDFVNKNIVIKRDEAEKLFAVWDELPHASTTAYQWMFNLCHKVSVFMPPEAFQYTLRLFEEQPSLLSGDNTLHPGYIYQPSAQRTFDFCPVCGGRGQPYYRALSYQMADFAYPDLPVKLWMKCDGCGNLYTWKYPEDFLARAADAAWVSPNPDRYLTTISATNGISLAAWSGLLNKLRTYTGGKDLLEVGIGQGELLAVAQEMGYEADAVEVSPEVAQKVADMLSIPIWRGDFLDYAPNKTYSIITMGDVLEHICEPVRALKNAFKLLKDDGVLWLSTPNFESAFSKMLKFSDPMWMEPHHVSYFSRKGLEVLIEKCGFDLCEYSVSRSYNGSMELILKKHHPQLEMEN